MHIQKWITVGLMLVGAPAWAQSDLTLWYDEPATEWTEALPIGNGRLGAMVFGGAAEEHLQYNEETLWTGEPREYARPGAAQYLPEIRRLIAEGKQAEAEALANEHFMGLKSHEADYDQQREAWIQQVKAGPHPPEATADFDDSQWKPMEVPVSQGWERIGLEDMVAVDGAVWFRTQFEVPKGWKRKDLMLELGRIRDDDITFVNGQQVGTTQGKDEIRRYTIPAKLLKKGKNQLAVQVLNYYDKGGLTGPKGTDRPLCVYPQGAPDQRVSIEGTWTYWVQNDEPPAYPQYEASYQPFGDLYLAFPEHEAATNYRRELNISEAVARTSYQHNGVTFTREYFASVPNQTMVVHLTASTPGQLSFTTSLTSPHKKSSTRKLDDRTLALSLQVQNGALRGESQLRAEAKGGQVSVTDSGIQVQGADEVTLYLTAGTNYVNYHDVSGDPVQVCQQALKSLQGKTYAQMRDAHVQDYQQYFNQLSIDLGHSANEDLPTDERIAEFGSSNDPALMALYVQFGRYLLLATSRPGTRPPNIQGIWNDLLNPPWGSKYTTNINVEMIYWAAEKLNLSAMHEPLFDMIDDLEAQGAKTAKVHYGADGWVLHHNTDLWRGTAPINNANHGIWVSGAGWLSHHLWEHYLYTQDKQFLRDRAYPAMKGAAEFYVDFLVEDPASGWLISTPSNSPENGGLVAGPTMDHQIIRSLFQKTIEASELLGIDAAFRDTLATLWPKIAPNQIGQHGQLQEWLADVDDPTNHHRHVSHLWGIHPGDDITWRKTPELMAAAQQSLEYRGDEGTGWSLAWKINFWARLKDGNHAYKMIQMLLSPAADGGGSYPSLLDAHPPFQIDGNFGGAVGIAEMLVQSHDGGIELLPALPAALPLGDVDGLKARGGFTLHLMWEEGKLKGIDVTSTAGEGCVLRYGDKEIAFETETGQTYRLDGNLMRL
ncbi:alpha-L-fucosidase 2 [Catalinimonas alkaloidigena]|uniref:Alpha-L-fucosidase 2 n=1 Tax=Catalinimonas alkaloidigena TaxID=1075417 RepID=A0A1G9QH90_9BACT|nr:glycoside hydrolase N-terminal domain-containing protein [Catalinimonas alkaloidigena]SDM10422.1 alpha-L-fucosidase 2 [Catalinimonas alkaloidigena]